MGAWLADNWHVVATLTTAAAGLVVAVVYALNQMTRQIATLTGSMVTEVQSALGTANEDRKLEVAVFQHYLEDSRETRRALTDAQVELRAIQATVRAQAEEVSTLKVNMAQRRHEADEALVALQRSRSQAEATQREYDAQRGALMEQVAQLTDEVNRLKDRVQSLEEAGRRKQLALDEVTAQRDALADEVRTLTARNTQLVNNNASLREQIAAIRHELDDLKQRLETKDDDDKTKFASGDGAGDSADPGIPGHPDGGTGGGDGASG